MSLNHIAGCSSELVGSNQAKRTTSLVEEGGNVSQRQRVRVRDVIDGRYGPGEEGVSEQKTE
jgi:hypothetical protein